MTFGIPNPETPLEYHYVVKYNTATGEIDMDYETQSAVFGSGPVYDPASNDWRKLYDHEWENDNTLYNDAGDNLYRVINNTLNKRLP